MPDAIVLRNLTKTFGSKIAVADLDLVVPQGALYGVIGPNGAGKTTAIRMMLSILFPDHGEIAILGQRSALDAKDRIGYLPEERGIYKKMRVRQFLAYMASLKGVADEGLDELVERWLARVDLVEAAGRRCEELSKGMQQKVQLIAAMIHEPDLLILDEPFSGLDPVNQRLLRQLVIDEHRRGATVLFSTHVMVHAEQLCDHVVMIHQGRKVLDETMAGIRTRFDPRSLVFEPIDPAADVHALMRLPGVLGVRRNGQAWEIALEEGTDPGGAIAAVAAALPLSRVEVHRPTLEDVFVNIVAGDAANPEEDRSLRAAVRDEAVDPSPTEVQA